MEGGEGRWNGCLNQPELPAVRAAVKTELSYRNDMIIVFLSAANKNKNNGKVNLATCNT